MSDSSKKFYLTTPIYYVNARPHIGHAYSTIVADVLARRHRLLGDETYFLTGTDEHGQKIERSAAAAGIAPQAFADKNSAYFSGLWARMGITHDDFLRTTGPRHIRGAQRLFTELYDRGQIYLSTYTGQYSIGEEMFVDGPPGTLGPDGKPTETVTEENFFFKLSEYQQPLLNLIESNELLITPDTARNEVLSFLRGGLRDLSVSRSSFTWGIPVPDAVQQDAKATQKHVIYVWLDALANYMTALGYGSDDTTLFDRYWPADLHLVGKEITRFHCIYWPAFLLAAGLPLPKQITANGWLLFDNAKMSKSRGNVVRTETILDAFGTLCPALPAPTTTFSSFAAGGGSASSEVARSGGSSGLQANESSTNAESALAAEGESPTPHDRDLFAADVLRYFLLREIPFGQDGTFSFEAMVTRYNADLANGYGNLVSRTFKMISNYFGNEAPVISPSVLEKALTLVNLQATFAFKHQFLAPILQDFDAYRFDRYLQGVTVLVTVTDETLSLMAPWKHCDSDEKTLENRQQALSYSWEMIRIITALLYPILPYATARVWAQLGLGDIEAAAANGELRNLTWGGLQPGTKLGPLGPIFPRAPKELVQMMTDMEEKNSAPQPAATTDPAAGPRTASLDGPSGTLPVAGSTAHTTGPDGMGSHTSAPASGIFAAQPSASESDATPTIAIDDFARIDLRVAQVLVCERIPKADKLLRLEVDLGPMGKRQILSGIAEWYSPEDLIGRRIVVITNLAPRKMRGLESHGMLLAASEEGGKPVLATFSEDIALGSRLK